MCDRVSENNMLEKSSSFVMPHGGLGRQAFKGKGAYTCICSVRIELSAGLLRVILI